MKSTSAAIVLAAAGAALAKNAITYPDTALDLHFGDSVVVSYTTDYETPWLYIFCENGDVLQEVIYYSPSSLVDASSITFDLTYDYMPAGKCFFNLRPAQRDADDNDASVGASSPAFDYDQAEGSRETFSAGGGDKAPASSKTSAAASKTAAESSVTTASGTAITTEPPAQTSAGGDDDEEDTSATPTANMTSSSPAPVTSESTLPEGAGARVGVATGAVLLAAAAALLA